MDKYVDDRGLDEPRDPSRRRVLGGIAAVGMGLALGGCETAPEGARADARLDQALRSHVRNIIVIYAENRSFSNLYGNFPGVRHPRSEEHTSELQSLMRISYAVFCLKQKQKTK